MTDQQPADASAIPDEHRSIIRPCGPAEKRDILDIIAAASRAYEGTIPEDCWRDPYMTSRELSSEMDDGVRFLGYELDRELIGIMGLQRRASVYLIRHAYVHPARQRDGIGRRLLQKLLEGLDRPVLVGTWAAAEWAIDFYAGNGFFRVDDGDAATLLEHFWEVPARQMASSVVLSRPPLTHDEVIHLVSR